MIRIKQLSEQELLQHGVRSWPVWEKEVSRFAWTYQEEEWCYFLKGEVVIETDAGHFEIKPGDFVVFPAGLECIWDIRKQVSKHYNFH